MGKTLDEQIKRAELAKLKAETAYANQCSQKREYENWAMEIAKREQEQSADAQRLFSFFGDVTKSSAAGCLHTVQQWHREAPDRPITICFNSPGGSVTDGLALYDAIKRIQDTGLEINTESLGWAASMGGVLLQAGNTRAMGKHAYMMIHEVSNVALGNVSEIEDELKFTKRLQERLLDILAHRATIDRQQIKRNWKRKDWWLDANEALELGFIDEII